jgi:tRNA pseudouridine38-40 synthase
VRTFRGTVHYDGTAYAGFQVQAKAPTVQGALEDALAGVTGQTTRVVGAGRTDAGVHARGQVISFRSATDLATDTLQRALNALLPEDIVLLSLEEAPADFHARYAARSRAYEYVVYNMPWPSPFWRCYSYHVPELLDVARMGCALEPLLGEHDFAAFGMPMERTRAGTTVRSTTTRTLLAARCWAVQPCVYFYLEANAFLRHMVRLIVGTVLRVGQGRLAPSAVREILAARRLAASGPAVPARGLYLVKVTYE